MTAACASVLCALQQADIAELKAQLRKAEADIKLFSHDVNKEEATEPFDKGAHHDDDAVAEQDEAPPTPRAPDIIHHVLLNQAGSLLSQLLREACGGAQAQQGEQAPSQVSKPRRVPLIASDSVIWAPP